MNRVSQVVALAMMLAAATGFASESYWTGRGDNASWSQAENWHDGNIPSSTDTACFNGNDISKDAILDISSQDLVVGGLNVGGNEYKVMLKAEEGEGSFTTGWIDLGQNSWRGYYPGYLSISNGVKVTTGTGTIKIGECKIGDFDDFIANEAVYWPSNCCLEVCGGSVEEWMIRIGYADKSVGTLVVSGGTVTSTYEVVIAQGNHALGRLQMDGGKLTTKYNGVVFFGDNGWTDQERNDTIGELVLNGGELEVRRIKITGLTEGANAISRVVFNGGTVRPTEDTTTFMDASSFTSVNIAEGGLIVDTAGHDITISGDLTGVGGVTKKGEGTLKIANGKKWGGVTTVLGGSLDLNGTELSGDIAIGGDGKFTNFTKGSISSLRISGSQDVDIGKWGASKVIIASESANIKSPLRAILDEAPVWFDPSDTSTLMYDGNGEVTAVANKGADGASMNAELMDYDGKDENDNEIYWPVQTGSINGLNALSFTNQYGFSTSKNHAFSSGDGRAIFIVEQQVNYDWRKLRVAQWGRADADWDSYDVFAISSGGKEESYAGVIDSNGDRQGLAVEFYGLYSTDVAIVASMNAYNGTLTGMNKSWRDGELKCEYNSAPYISLAYQDTMRVTYGWQRTWHNRTTGLVGEALYYDRGLDEVEAELVNHYLSRKWLVGNTLEENRGNTTIAALELSGGTASFDGALLTIDDLSGTGALTDFASLTVTGNISVTAGGALTLDGDVDFTGSTITPAVDFDVGDAFTITCTGMVTGQPSVVLGEGDKRKFKVAKVGSTITLTRVKPGLVIIVAGVSAKLPSEHI